MAKDYITMDVSIKEIKNLLIKNLSWRLDKIKTLSLPGTKDDFYIPVRVEAINLYREPSIEVRFKMVNTTDQEVFDMYYVDDYRLAFKSEDPEQTLDEIEKIPDEV